MTYASWLWLWTISCCCCLPTWSLASRATGRRAALGGLASLASSPSAFAAGPPSGGAVPSGLEARLSATLLSPLPGAALFNPLDDRQTYYPTWLFGRWNTTATFVGRTLPFGAEVGVYCFLALVVCLTGGSRLRRCVPRESVYYRSMAEGSPRSRSELVGSTT